MESVRLAESTDRDRLGELVAELVDGLPSLRGGPELLRLDLRPGGDGAVGAGTDPVAAAASLVAAWLVPSAERVMFAGLLDGVVVGLGAASADPGLRRGRIECCYVEAPARGVGVGAELMAAMVGWLGTAGCTDIDAPALPGDRSTKQLFEAAGFKARRLILHRRLD